MSYQGDNVVPLPPYNFLNLIVHEHTEMKFIINFIALIISAAVFFFFFFLQNLLFGPYLFTNLSKVSFHCQFSQINPCIFLFQAIKYNLSKLKIYLNQWSSRLQVNLFFPFILISSLTPPSHPSHWVVSFFVNLVNCTLLAEIENIRI